MFSMPVASVTQSDFGERFILMKKESGLPRSVYESLSCKRKEIAEMVAAWSQAVPTAIVPARKPERTISCHRACSTCRYRS
jgi:hypothetical protein